MHGGAEIPNPKSRAEGCAQAGLRAQRHLRGSPHMGPPISDCCTPEVLLKTKHSALAMGLAIASRLYLNILHCIGLAALYRDRAGESKQSVPDHTGLYWISSAITSKNRSASNGSAGQ